MVAPNFDATFLRMLAQKGKAYTAGSAAITVVNDFTSPAATGWDDASYRFKFVPQFQNIRKDEEQTTTIEAVTGMIPDLENVQPSEPEMVTQETKVVPETETSQETQSTEQASEEAQEGEAEQAEENEYKPLTPDEFFL